MTTPDAGTGNADQWARQIQTSNRHATAGVALSLSCGHAVLRRPNYQITSDLMTDCEVCAAEGQTNE